MSDVVLVLLPAQYQVTIHYADCCCYARVVPRDLPFPRSVRFVRCKKCAPAEDDIRAAVPGWAEIICWYLYSPTPGRVSFLPWFEGAERVAARRELGWGRTPARSTNWGRR